MTSHILDHKSVYFISQKSFSFRDSKEGCKYQGPRPAIAIPRNRSSPLLEPHRNKDWDATVLCSVHGLQMLTTHRGNMISVQGAMLVASHLALCDSDRTVSAEHMAFIRYGHAGSSVELRSEYNNIYVEWRKAVALAYEVVVRMLSTLLWSRESPSFGIEGWNGPRIPMRSWWWSVVAINSHCHCSNCPINLRISSAADGKSSWVIVFCSMQ